MRIHTTIKSGKIALNHDHVIVTRKRRLQGGFR
jgi:hypothetical protein